MRQAGTISNARDAQRFTAHLVAQGIAAVTETEGNLWAIWIREEDQLPKAKDELAQYLANPQHPRYDDAEKIAAEKLREEVHRRQKAMQNVRNVGSTWTNVRVTAGPLTQAVIALCAVVFVLTDFGSSARRGGESTIERTLSFVDMPTSASLRGMSDAEIERMTTPDGGIAPLTSIRRGELWRLVTPIFLHLGFLHIIFNMLMFHSLASLVESRCGTGRLAMLILGIAVISNLGQALTPLDWGGTPHFGGMSGVVYGLLGFAWMKTRYEPLLGIRIRGDVVAFLMVCMALGWIMPMGDVRMANWAHLYGFLSGMAFGFLPVLMGKARA